jgi:predicted TIM-barrel fold metal-dependent hydrolase
MKSKHWDRREFLAAAGIATMTPLHASLTRAQTAEEKVAGVLLRVVDFHNHYIGPGLKSIAGARAPIAQRAYWDGVNRNLSDPAALLSSIDAAGIAARVINTPLEFLQDADSDVDPDTPKRINDQLAELVAMHPRRLYGLATVDAYAGDAGATELTRAVRELGLRGVFVASAKKDLFLDTPQARPTLAAAATLGVPVFVHPITDAQIHKRLASYGTLGTTLNRGVINAASLVALLESGTFEQLPNLRVVVTTLAIGGVLLAGASGDSRNANRDRRGLLRRHVYIDTMGLQPTLIRSMIDVLGADHILAGTDWPIFEELSVPQRLQAALSACGLGATEQQMIASGNALKLLGV